MLQLGNKNEECISGRDGVSASAHSDGERPDAVFSRREHLSGEICPDNSDTKEACRPNDGRPAYEPLRICAASAYVFLYVQYGHVRAGAGKGKRFPELRG